MWTSFVSRIPHYSRRLNRGFSKYFQPDPRIVCVFMPQHIAFKFRVACQIVTDRAPGCGRHPITNLGQLKAKGAGTYPIMGIRLSNDESNDEPTNMTAAFIFLGFVSSRRSDIEASESALNLLVQIVDIKGISKKPRDISFWFVYCPGKRQGIMQICRCQAGFAILHLGLRGHFHLFPFSSREICSILNFLKDSQQEKLQVIDWTGSC